MNSETIRTDKRKTAALAVNAAVIIAEIIGIILSFRNNGIGMLKFYTEDSNILALLACVFYVIYVALKGKREEIPLWVRLLKYMSVCCLTVTFIVVIFILIPTGGEGSFKKMLFSDAMLYHHLLCPLGATASFIFLEGDMQLKPRHTLFALIPTVAYACVTTPLNIARIMDGPYPFLRVHNQPVFMSVIWFTVILAGAFFLALLIRLANKKFGN